KSRWVNACAARVPGAMPKCLSSASPTRCGGLPRALPAPRLTLGSRKRVGLSCAWQSVICSRPTLPKGRSASYRCSPSAPSAARLASIGNPATAAATSPCRNSRRFTIRQVRDPATPATRAGASSSLVDRRSGIHQQRGDVLDLLLGQDAVMAEARHRRAGGERLRVEDLAVGIALGLGAVAAKLAEPVKARPYRAVGELLRRELMAGVAIASDRSVGIVRVLLAAAVLRDLFAIFPVAGQFAVGWIFDRRQILFFDPFGDVLRRGLAGGLAAQPLRIVLVEPIEPRLASSLERRLDHRTGLGRDAFIRGRSRAADQNCREQCRGQHHSGDHSCALQRLIAGPSNAAPLAFFARSIVSA